MTHKGDIIMRRTIFSLMAMLLLAILAMALTSCTSMKAITPYGQVSTETDSQILVYTDADVDITADQTESDDTTLIVVGVKDSTGADLDSIFNHAMTEIRKIFHARQRVYERWLRKGD